MPPYDDDDPVAAFHARLADAETMRELRYAADRAERVVARARESMPPDDDDRIVALARAQHRMRRAVWHMRLAYVLLIAVLVWLVALYASR